MRTLRAVAAAAALAMVAGLLLAPSSQATTCEQVRFIGLRGSGQTAADYGGYGAQVDAARASYVRLLEQLHPGVAHSEVPLDYDAASVDVIKRYGYGPQLWMGVRDFVESVQDGVTKLSTEMHRASPGCAAPLLLLVGYSQGAMAIHWALTLSSNADVLSRIASVQMFADPLRHGSSSTNMGSASEGTNGVATSAGVGPTSDVPSEIRGSGRTMSWCEASDLVCDWGATTAAMVNTGTPQLVHSQTYQYGDAQTAGAIAARKANLAVNAQPDPVPAPPVGINRPDPTGYEATTPPPRPPSASPWIAAGGNHTCALINDGRARCWGHNDAGQLGDGTSADRSTPVTVSGLGNAVAITAGWAHTCALINDGTARCWGDNYSGQLGDGTDHDRGTPVAVSGLSGAVAITAGSAHTCALINDGTARCWGSNLFGGLGDGTDHDRGTPVAVSGLSGAVAITAGWAHTCALINDGTARCWGYNAYGQLGDGTGANRSTPVTVLNYPGLLPP